MATPVQNHPIAHCKPLSIEYFMYVYGLYLLFDFATKNLHLASIFYHLVDKWRLKDFVNFEPCVSCNTYYDSTIEDFHAKRMSIPNLWQTDLLICTPFSRNNIYTKTHFLSAVFWSKSFEGGFWRDANLLVTSTFGQHSFFRIDVFIFEEVEK